MHPAVRQQRTRQVGEREQAGCKAMHQGDTQGRHETETKLQANRI